MMTTEKKCLSVPSLSEESDLEREVAAKWPQGYPLQKGLSLSNVWEIWIWLFSPACNNHFIYLALKDKQFSPELGNEKTTHHQLIKWDIYTCGSLQSQNHPVNQCPSSFHVLVGAVLVKHIWAWEASRPVFKSHLLHTWHWVGHPSLLRLNSLTLKVETILVAAKITSARHIAQGLPHSVSILNVCPTPL